MSKAASVPLARIALNPDFDLRHVRDDHHTAQMTLHLRRGGKLPPVALWQDATRTDGKLTLIDGHYRLAAHRAAKGDRPIRAIILTGTVQEAVTQAVEANCKLGMALTATERADAAWRLVRLPKPRPSQQATWTAAGVSRSTVKRMWGMWRAIRNEGFEGQVTGRWHRDRHLLRGTDVEWEPPTDEVRVAEIEASAKVMRQGFDMLSRREGSMRAEAVELAFGERELRSVFDYLGYTEPMPFDEDDSEEEEELDAPPRIRYGHRPGHRTTCLLDGTNPDTNPDF